MQGWFSILLLMILGAAFGAGSIVLSTLLGAAQADAREAGALRVRHAGRVGDARERHPIKFYLIAMIFLLFDIEVAFLYPWAMALRDLAWPGFVQILVFFAILLAGYAYVWKKGALTWDKP